MSDKNYKYSQVKELCSTNENIIDRLSDGRKLLTTSVDEMISYDIRAGVDSEEFEKNPEFTISVSNKIAEYINSLGLTDFSVMECGCGEGTKIINLLNVLEHGVSWAFGIDISWSRIKYAINNYKKFGEKKELCHFCVADMFSLPFEDESIDIVYTMQGIYAMGGSEKRVVKELLRVASQYLILIEPSYELASEDARSRMVRLNYVKGLKYVVEELGYKILKFEPFGVDSNPKNPAAVIIVEKNFNKSRKKNSADVQLCDPITHDRLELVKNVYFSIGSKLSYPVIDGIPCLTPDNAIVTTKLI